MKKQLIMGLLFLIGILPQITQSISAQASDKTKRQMYINAKGEVMDRGIKLGHISKEDIVYNNKGKKLGFIKNGKVYDAEGNSLGKAKKGGKYYNESGAFVLYVDGDDEKCKILDPKGHVLGYVHKNYKLHACATHCFFKEKNIEEDMDAILTGYMNIENALAEDNNELAQQQATEFLNDSTGLNETHMKKSLEEIANATDINVQRKYFAILSKELYTIFKETGVKEKTLYWIHCPMALQGNGAFWLSASEHFNNPYMGKQMPTCGSLTATLK